MKRIGFMKQIKKHLIVIMAVFCGFLMGACGLQAVNAEQENPIKIWEQNENGQLHTALVVDEEKGMEYIVAYVKYSKGHSAEGISIMPRLSGDETTDSAK